MKTFVKDFAANLFNQNVFNPLYLVVNKFSFLLEWKYKIIIYGTIT